MYVLEEINTRQIKMITDINVEEVWNKDGNCWDSIIQWKYNGTLNKVACTANSEKSRVLLKLVEGQCVTTKEILTKIVYRKR